MTFFIIYTTAIVLCWSVGKILEVIVCGHLSDSEVHASFCKDSDNGDIYVSILSIIAPILGTTTSAQLVKVQPPPPTPLTSPATVTATVDERVIVLCIESGGTVQWYGPDGGVVPSSGDVRQTDVSNRRSLLFASYQSSQGGQYQCRTSKDCTNSTLYVTLGE